MDNSIDKLISKRTEDIESGKNVFGTGKVTKVMDFMVEAVGLDNAFFYERIKVGEKSIGYVTKLDTNKVIISLVYKEGNISIGDMVTETGEELTGEFSPDSMGKIIDLFGNDKLVNKKFINTINIPIEHEIVPIMDRTSVNRPLETGIAGIDLIYPIGRGQRQLIIGDKKTGKTQIALDAIVNQADKKVLCIYVAIGKTKKEVKEIYYELLKRKATEYTIMVTAFYDDVPPLLYLTPYFATSIADYYMRNGFDVLVVIDDLKRHADAYREISLLSGKSPGRDAYPADIFYSHSRMLESGCQYKNGASITILPIVETKAGVITDYISTNIISITDGQIVLSAKNFQKGQKPAINYGLSVSRLGGAVQTPEMKKLGTKIKQQLLSYLETRDIYELANTDEMSKELQTKLFEGKKILDNLNQNKFSPLSSFEIRKRFDPNAKMEAADNVNITTKSISSLKPGVPINNETPIAPAPMDNSKRIDAKPVSAPVNTGETKPLGAPNVNNIPVTPLTLDDAKKVDVPVKKVAKDDKLIEEKKEAVKEEIKAPVKPEVKLENNTPSQEIKPNNNPVKPGTVASPKVEVQPPVTPNKPSGDNK